MFVSSHLLAEVEQTCSRSRVLDRGRLVVQDEVVVMMLEPQLPAVAQMLREAKEEITAFADF